MFTNIFGSPSRSYAQKTPPRSRHPPSVPLPPSPSPTPLDSGNKTPGLGMLDNTFSPGPDLLLTPDGTISPRNGLQSSQTMSSFGTPRRSSGGVDRTPGDEVKQGEVLPPASAEEAKRKGPPVLEDFELVRVIGKGCAGRVMMVRHHPTGNVHAMKAISKRSVLAHDELNHTLTEINILKQSAIHEPNNPFIVKLNYAFTDKENIYFVMDFYPGGDLATQMEIGTLGHTRTRFYAAEISQGLMDLHRHGIIVRDLKPENVLLDADGHAVLADFGLSRQFGYRGEPQPILVPQYDNRPTVPYWAGKGLGSLRTGMNGKPMVAVDRANSFVGTAEYISPEVIKCAQYSYAIDWWALGCIVVEGIVGRVPFRLHTDEAPELLWDRILLDSWRDVFYDHKVAEKSLEDYLLDEVTLDFIDSLLEKDPNMRLTEPFVIQHPFFHGLEWETVAKRGYADPHGLMIHPKIEYNLHYFPRLCLEETPTVDMGTHDIGRSSGDLDENGEPVHKTPLNDDETYELAHAEANEAFVNFEWSRDDLPWERQESHGLGRPSADMGSEGEVVGLGLGLEGEMDGQTLNWSVSEAFSEGVEGAEAYDGLSPGLDLPALPLDREMGPGDYDSDPEVDIGAAGRPSTDTVPAATIPLPDSDDASLASPADRRLSVLSGLSDVEVTENAKIEPASIPIPKDDASPTLAPLSPASSQSRLQPSSPASVAIKIPSPRPKSKLKLPPGLPASGLSVSDIVSIPSPDPNSPTRLVRRHNPGLSIDTIPNPRLSVDLHGTISQLGDEDWEKLEMDTNTSIPSIPNAAPSAFFTRGFGHTLRRRPSQIVTSGLRRVHKTSSSSGESGSNTNTNTNVGNSRNGSRNTSPTKHRQLFTVKSIENTKKAFRNLKVFPKMKRDVRDRPKGQNLDINTSTTPSTPVSPPRQGNEREGGKAKTTLPSSTVPSASAPSTGTSSWFTTRRFGISRSFKPSNTTTSSASSGSSTSHPAPAPPARRAGPQPDEVTSGAKVGVPRVELTHTPPVVWELDATSPQPREPEGPKNEEVRQSVQESESSEREKGALDEPTSTRETIGIGRPSTSS